jgi:plasmid stabilization system protein ParE
VKTVLRDSAVADLERICGYIAEDSPANARAVAQRLLDAIENGIAWFPYMGRVGRVRGTRECVVRGLPFIVVYRVDDQRGIVWVEAVFHGAQDR